jgi:hypothetical protein
MSNQSRSQVIAHVSARRNRCTAFECNAQLATQRDSGPTVAPQRVCHYGTRKPQTMGPPPKNTAFLGRGNSRAIRHSLFVLSDPQLPSQRIAL